MAPINTYRDLSERDTMPFALLFREAAPATTGISSLALPIGIGAGVGAVILLACVAVVLRILHVRKRHSQAVAELEEGATVSPTVHQRQMSEVPRPVSSCHGSTLSSGVWSALASIDTINEPELVARPDGKRKRSESLPERMRKGVVPLKPFKLLSVIIENPRMSISYPSFDRWEAIEWMPGPPQPFQLPQAITSTEQPAEAQDILASTVPESPKLSVQPSFAIRSLGQYDAALANEDDKPKVSRSVSMGVLEDMDGAVFGSTEHLPNISKRRRPVMHDRSVSLGAPLSKTPTSPVPALPTLSPLTMANVENMRQAVCVSRRSSSAGSSVVVTDNGPLKTIAKHQHPNGPRSVPTANMSSGRYTGARSSGRRKIVRSSTDSALTSHRSLTSSSSIGSWASGRTNRLSIPTIGTAERVSLCRISSSNSIVGPGGIKKITTPTKRGRTANRQSSVSIRGSPAERLRVSVLREISVNAGYIKPSPTRAPSQSSLHSNRTSNGNPFQWDSSNSNTSPKPSALKGSPKARKGHRRHNCVRISTLTPQVLGPSSSSSSSRSPSPAPGTLTMDGIQEERESEDVVHELSRQQEMHLARGARLPSASASTDRLRGQTLRASLTPSSPTLSTWNAYQREYGLPSQNSDSDLAVSPIARSGSRQSERSLFVIPQFPSPARKSEPSVSPIQYDTTPMPEFMLPCPVSDEEIEIPSSPPSFWNSPSCSPTTISDSELPEIPAKNPRRQEQAPLTSQNASAMMAKIPRQMSVGFPGDNVPILAPPQTDDDDVYFPRWESRFPEEDEIEEKEQVNTAHRAISTGCAKRPSLSTIMQSSSSPAPIPSPLNIPTSVKNARRSGSPVPMGPRSAPAKSVLKNAAALRRMNSEVQCHRSRESSTYMRLGREASPLLPWIGGNTDPNDSANDLINFVFNTRCGADSEQDSRRGNVMDEIDMAAFEKKIDGAFAGFVAEFRSHSHSRQNTPTRVRVRRESEKENIEPVNRSSCVWEDGEMYWSGQQQRLGTPKREWLVTTTLDPRLLSSPAGMGSGRPKSLYDSDGFLRV